MPAENREVVLAFFRGLNERDLESASSLIDPDFLHHSTGARGAEGMRGIGEKFLEGFPDMKIVVEDVVGDGDRVATRGHWTGTHHGEFMEVPATGRVVKVGFFDIWRVVDGKLVENWLQMDYLGAMMQLGVVPDPTATAV